ncbi:MAG: carboxyl-terminal protease [Pseudobdellovibrio sp.]|jgi:carboxyl-terminal processing protease|nr:carboxyl-terminal protease [Pseudobdellovibrio sp.]
MKKRYLVIVLVMTICFLGGGPLKSFAQDRYTDLQIFSKVLSLVQQYYVEDVDTKKLVMGAIKGMLRELDPHTSYMPPEVYKDFETETAGEFGGLGIEISIQNGVLTIISPIEDTPAWKAGIKPGDKVVAIDGQSTKGYSLVEASSALKGKNGERIVLSVVRDNMDKPMDIPVVRGKVKIKSVKSTELDDGYIYVKITSFIEHTGSDLEKVLSDFKKKQDGKIAGILLDLRRNPGGLLEQAIKVSDLFLKEGVIVSTIGRDPKNKEVNYASKRAQFADIPIVILINEYSASASEIVAGALQDNKRAVIVGERSFGKGSVQSAIKLSDGSALKLTVARYYTPSGVSIQSEGIKPDIEIEDIGADVFAKATNKPATMRERDMTGHLKGDKEKQAEKNKSVNQNLQNNSVAWWNDIGSKKDADLSDKDKLFKTDYQAYQAFSYLKAWRTLKSMNN